MTEQQHLLNDRVNTIVGVASRGADCSAALGKLLSEAITEELAHAVRTGKEPLSGRSVCLGVMKNMRQAMASVRDELDMAEGYGQYR